MPMARDTESHTEAAASRWWIAADGEPEGPHSEAYVRLVLEGAKAPADIRLCPVGGSKWRPAGDWQVFAATVNSHRRSPRRTRPSASPREFDPKYRPLWPLGIYALFASPVLFLLDVVTMFTGGSLASELSVDSPVWGYAVVLDVFWTLVNLGTTVYMAVSGWRLMNDTAQGIRPITYSLIANFFFGLLQFPFAVLWWSLVELDAAHRLPAQPLSAWLTGCFILFGGAALYELIMLIWLLLNRNWLMRIETNESGAR